MRTPARLALVVLLPALLGGLSGCTATGPIPSLGGSSAPSSRATPSPTPRPDVARIAAAARAAAGSGTVVSVHDESDGTSWEVRVVDAAGAEQEVHLDDAGVVRAGPTADGTDADARSDNRALVAAPDVSLAGARARMVAAVPRGRVTAIALTRYEDRVTWVGDVTDVEGVRHDVRVDAVDGGVVLDRADGPDPQPTSGGS